MGHLIELTDDSFTGDILTYSKTQWFVTMFPLFARQNTVQTYVGSLTVWHLNTDSTLTRNRCLNTKRLSGEIERNVRFKRGNAG
ncbi:hypothetical protein D3C72_1160600 [compost metagenome]